MTPIIPPCVITYLVGEKFKPVEWFVKGISARLIPFFPFTPNPVPSGRHQNRYQTLSEFQAFYTKILEPVPVYNEAWVAQATYEIHGNIHVQQAGIIYRNSNTFGIWQNNSNAFTLVWPPQRPRRPEMQQALISSPGVGSNPFPASKPDLGD
jgi:hypothetical protein